MKRIISAALVLMLLSACQPPLTPVTLMDGGEITAISSSSNIPSQILEQAGITLGADDRVLYAGVSVPLDAPLPEAGAYTLSIRRAVTLTLEMPAGKKTIQSSAQTIGQALAEAGYGLHLTDRIDPPAQTPITGVVTVHFEPGRPITISVDGTRVEGWSAAPTVGQALAESGVALNGLDYSIPDETASLPADGSVQVVRVVETVALTQKTLPFSTRTELSADLEIDQQQLLQGGEPGLTTVRVRTRTEDGVQVSQQQEGEVIVRPPQDRILGFGTKIVIRTTTVDGVTIEYWRALNLKATSYSPCDPDTPPEDCSNLTFNGQTVRKGIVAMVRSWFYLFESAHLFIPGYGEGVVADVGGGWPDGNHYWVDLGWTDADYTPLTYANGVTVYFLTPVPANPGYILP